MISIITRWEDSQMPRDLEHRMWRQLKGAFAVQQIRFVENGEELLAALVALPKTTAKVFLEPTGTHALSEIPYGDIALILGNTDHHNLAFSEPEERYRIYTDNPTHLYGINAAAIALAYRLGQ